MQHRYVPDLGDFSKFAVIDALSGRGQDRTALIWYLVDPDEVGDTHNNDGKHTAYLHDDRQGFERCYPELYRKFQAIDWLGEKHVGVYKRKRVLARVGYFDEPLSYAGLALPEREAWRAGWLNRAAAFAGTSEVVVLDPDNGLAGDGLSLRSRTAVKYATLNECAAFYGGGRRTLVVYQHAHRQGTVAEQADKALYRLALRLDKRRSELFALRFHRGTTRCYLVVPANGQGVSLRARGSALVNSAWGQRGHFSLID